MDASTSAAVADFLFTIPKLYNHPFEATFDPSETLKFANNNWPLVFGLCAVYLVMVFQGPVLMNSIMKDKGLELKYPLAAWNALLSVFSFIGCSRTVPYLLAQIISTPYRSTVCSKPLEMWGYGPTGCWVMLFIFSKIPELVDTIFIIIRKKPLIFLHWYHHVTVLLFCWSAFSTTAGSGLYFVAMNYTVHAMMYGYYSLSALGMMPKWFPTILITMAQIAQMFVGTGVCISCWYYRTMGITCHNELSNLLAGAIMYGSYLYLFCEFAVKRYVFKPNKKSSKKVE